MRLRRPASADIRSGFFEPFDNKKLSGLAFWNKTGTLLAIRFGARTCPEAEKTKGTKREFAGLDDPRGPRAEAV